MRLSPKANLPSQKIWGDIAFDKSLSHRGIIFSFLTKGECEIKNFLSSQDTLATLKIAEQLGAKVEYSRRDVLINPPQKIVEEAHLECGNSGTAMRLYAGLLSGVEGKYYFYGDKSLCSRPMGRIREPMERMGAKMNSSFAPFVLEGRGGLQGIEYHSPIASAQVKSAFILASFSALGVSKFSEPFLSRDHTERFLSALGAPIEITQEGIVIYPLSQTLDSFCFEIPNDPSSVIFFVIACLIGKNQTMTFKNVLLNPTRIEAFEVLKKMGANLEYQVVQERIEPIGEVRVSSSTLYSVEVKEKIAWLIDEIPALSIAFACAVGESRVYNAYELRSKECDRIKAIVRNLQNLGIEVKEFEDGFSIVGGEFKEGKIESFGDHRIAMSFALAGIKTKIELKDAECVDVSFPIFFELLKEFVEVEDR